MFPKLTCHKMIVHAVLVTLMLGLYVFCSVGCSSVSTSSVSTSSLVSPPTGNIDGTTYINKELGFGCTLPDSGLIQDVYASLKKGYDVWHDKDKDGNEIEVKREHVNFVLNPEYKPEYGDIPFSFPDFMALKIDCYPNSEVAQSQYDEMCKKLYASPSTEDFCGHSLYASRKGADQISYYYCDRNAVVYITICDSDSETYFSYFYTA